MGRPLHTQFDCIKVGFKGVHITRTCIPDVYAHVKFFNSLYIADFIPDTSGWNDETCTLDCGLVEQTSDGHRSTVSAPSVLFKFIIGKKGETKRRLETETRTQIRIPRQGQEGDIGNHIRILHECQVWIDKSVPRVTFWHHEARRVMPNCDPRDKFVYPYLT